MRMNIDVAFGQYFEGDSIIHRLDPRFKLIMTVLAIVVIFLAKNIFSFLLILLVTMTMILMTGIPPKIILKGMKSLLFIIVFTALINIFWLKGRNTTCQYRFYPYLSRRNYQRISDSFQNSSPSCVNKHSSDLHDYSAESHGRS